MVDVTATRVMDVLQGLRGARFVRTMRRAIDGWLRNQHELGPALDAMRHEISTADAGKIVYYADEAASGRPLVLLHGIHAAASSHEMKPIFEHFRKQRPVYALDLPGFGMSERARRPYLPETYVHAIEHMLRNVSILRSRTDEARTPIREPVDVVALSLSSEYAAKVALEMPELVNSLVLISPTGFARDDEQGWLERLSRQRRGSLPSQLLELPPSRLFYELLVSRPSLRWFLRKSFEHEIDRDVLEYAWNTSHQAGAHRAPLSFASGALFPRGEPRNVYAHVRVPTLVLYDRDPYTSFSTLSQFAEAHPNYRIARVSPSHGLPQFDLPEESFAHLRAFFEEQDLRQGRRFGAFSRYLGSA